MNDNSKVILGVFAGLAAGAAIGLLLAPETGSDLRNKISDGIQSANDDVKDTVSGLRSSLEDTFKSLENDIRRLINNQKDSIQDHTESLIKKKDAVSRKARELGEEIVA